MGNGERPLWVQTTVELQYQLLHHVLVLLFVASPRRRRQRRTVLACFLQTVSSKSRFDAAWLPKSCKLTNKVAEAEKEVEYVSLVRWLGDTLQDDDVVSVSCRGCLHPSSFQAAVPQLGATRYSENPSKLFARVEEYVTGRAPGTADTFASAQLSGLLEAERLLSSRSTAFFPPHMERKFAFTRADSIHRSQYQDSDLIGSGFQYCWQCSAPSPFQRRPASSRDTKSITKCSVLDRPSEQSVLFRSQPISPAATLVHGKEIAGDVLGFSSRSTNRPLPIFLALGNMALLRPPSSSCPPRSRSRFAV